MKIQKIEDIVAWQKAQDLATEVYPQFSGVKDFTFKDQICRAVISVSNNIAEGFDRKTDKEFSYFLYIALGSSSEVKSMLYLSEKLGYISKNDHQKHIDQGSEVARVIRGFIKSITNNSKLTA